MRMFFGLWPDAATRATFAGEDKTVFSGNGGKQVPPDEYHITVRYLGVIPEPLHQAIEELGARAAKTVAASVIELDEVAWWKESKVLVRVASQLPRELFELDQVLLVGLKALGVAVDLKPLKVHLTLTRSCPPFPNGLGKASPLAWDADSLALIEASPDPAGPRYRVRKQWKLGA